MSSITSLNNNIFLETKNSLNELESLEFQIDSTSFADSQIVPALEKLACIKQSFAAWELISPIRKETVRIANEHSFSNLQKEKFVKRSIDFAGLSRQKLIIL